ncbi:MAG TPA: YHS domain-containing protein [Candidatus Omnitrophota bacterium]|nr:YHS domain-containing protein [Candidatus Omnitrophota bacterium]
MSVKLTIFLLGFLLLSASNILAEEEQAPVAEPTEAATTETTEGLIMVSNTFCPVSGKEVGKMGKIIQQEYNGKVYNFCCSMCLKDFNKAPERYVKMVEEMMAKEAAEGQMQDQEHQPE